MKNEKFICILIIVFLFLYFFTIPVFAKSAYVLPYPSFLPGSKFYEISRVWESLSKYWYFGNISQFKYSLKESDKYLVEAKTLFEYQQYLLGYKALEKSNSYFSLTLPFLMKAQGEYKNITVERAILKEASLKHIEVLSELAQKLPAVFIWQDEKANPITLQFMKLIKDAKTIRQEGL